MKFEGMYFENSLATLKKLSLGGCFEVTFGMA
jgi:hypothetical protein